MNRPLLQRLANQLTDLDPREAALQALALVISDTKARAAAVFRDGEPPQLLFSLNIDQSAFECLETWSRRRGRAALLEQSALVTPISDDLVLYLDQPDKAALAHALEQLGPVLVTAARKAAGASTESPAVRRFLEETPVADIERKQLVLQLERHEWNISRVARLRGVERVTIYRLLARLGIRRLRVNKS